MNSIRAVKAGTIALVLFLFAACSTSPREVSLSSQQAMTLALRLANAEAMRLFEIEPFDTNRADIRQVEDRWHWHALVGFGKADLIGDVTFRKDGSEPRVKVQMCTSYPMIERRLERPLPDRSEPRHLGPPEKMPK